MKFSKRWLDQLLGKNIPTPQLVEQLTYVGLEVEDVIKKDPDFSQIVVGEILESVQHPNADRLRVCKVKINAAEEPLQIICGAPNAKVGLKTAVALVGAKLPGGVTIKPVKLRGIESFGMLCSERELQLSDAETGAAGIIELPIDAPLGESLATYLLIDDEVIDLNVTPNRGDAMSMLGVAREVAAINHLKPPRLPEHQILEGIAQGRVDVTVVAKDRCPYYTVRRISEINNHYPTPTFMVAALRAAGMRSINFIVDVTNYVMLYLGQPLHAFDAKLVNGALTVRLATAGERLTLLDQTKINLTSEDLIITDETQPLLLAGVMGGEACGITQNTTEIILESAIFDAKQIMLTTQRHHKLTEAAVRYTRGVDPELQLLALNLATEFLTKLAGGTASSVTEFKASSFSTQKTCIKLTCRFLYDRLGIEISRSEISNIFKELGIKIKVENEDGWELLIPVYRHDLTIPEDLTEEIARVYGYDKLPELPLEAELIYTHHQENVGRTAAKFRDLAKLCADLGYSEAITYSFLDAGTLKLFTPEAVLRSLANPLNQELAVMRNSLWPGLVKALKQNQLHQENRLKLFEIGKIFTAQTEEWSLAALLSGTRFPLHWDSSKSAILDFFDAKHDLELILVRLGIQQQQLVCEPFELDALHPRRSAHFLLGGEEIAVVGELHPRLKQHLALKGDVVLFELALEKLLHSISEPQKSVSVSKFPAMTRDLALIGRKNLVWQELVAAIKAEIGPLLEDVILFDRYSDETMGEEEQSIALRLVLRSMARTLTNEEVTQLEKQILAVLSSKFALKLRG